jgi:hypothetical protein
MVEDVEVETLGVPADAAVVLVLLGVESHRDLLGRNELSEYVFATLGLVGTVVTIVAWVRSAAESKLAKLAYAISLTFLAALASYQLLEIRHIRAVSTEARALLATWPEPDRIDFLSKGERIGIILGGMVFLEKHRTELPETYNLARLLIANRVKDFKVQPDEIGAPSEYDLLEDVAAAMIRLLQGVAGPDRR